jgi:hypothetical protein
MLTPHRKQQWVIPPEANATLVAAMEDVLEVHQRPHDPEKPLVCLDETSKQLIIETRKPTPAYCRPAPSRNRPQSNREPEQSKPGFERYAPFDASWAQENLLGYLWRRGP